MAGTRPGRARRLFRAGRLTRRRAAGLRRAPHFLRAGGCRLFGRRLVAQRLGCIDDQSRLLGVVAQLSDPLQAAATIGTPCQTLAIQREPRLNRYGDPFLSTT